jgi:SAM-dependent methyltransferase
MEQHKIWDAFQNDESLVGSFAAEKRLETIAKYIPEGSKVLNIGVGNGYLEKVLIDKDAMVHCLDPSAKSIERIREQLGLGERARTGYSQAIPFEDASFDFVVMSEVLEHLDDSILADTLADVRRVLRDDGHFLGTVPAEENLQDGLVVCPDCGKRFHRWGHVQSFTQGRLSELFSGHFEMARIQRRTFVGLQRLNWKGKTVGALKALQARLGIKGGGQNFLFDASGK